MLSTDVPRNDRNPNGNDGINNHCPTAMQKIRENKNLVCLVLCPDCRWTVVSLLVFSYPSKFSCIFPRWRAARIDWFVSVHCFDFEQPLAGALGVSRESPSGVGWKRNESNAFIVVRYALRRNSVRILLRLNVHKKITVNRLPS